MQHTTPHSQRSGTRFDLEVPLIWKYLVTLTETEREELKQLIAAGTSVARKVVFARIMFEADQSPEGPSWVDEAIAEAVGFLRKDGSSWL